MAADAVFDVERERAVEPELRLEVPLERVDFARVPDEPLERLLVLRPELLLAPDDDLEPEPLLLACGMTSSWM